MTSLRNEDDVRLWNQWARMNRWMAEGNYGEDMQSHLESMLEYRRLHPCRGWTRRDRQRRPYLLAGQCRCGRSRVRALCYVIAVLTMQLEDFTDQSYDLEDGDDDDYESLMPENCYCYPIMDDEFTDLLINFNPAASPSAMRQQYFYIKDMHSALCPHAAEAVLAYTSSRR